MVLDPLSSLSIASSVVQFIDFGCKLFSKSHELYKSASGESVEDIELRSVARSLEEFAGNASVLPLRSEGQDYSSGEKALLLIADSCKKQAASLNSILEPLKIEDRDEKSPKKWAAFRLALRRMMKSGEIDSISKRLDKLSHQLTACLMMMFCDNNSTTLQTLRDFYESTERWQTGSADKLQWLKETNIEMHKLLKSLSDATSSLLEHAKENQAPRIWPLREPPKLGQLSEITASLLPWVKASERVATQERFLDNLCYKMIRERQSKIVGAHAKTFQWIFDDRCSDPSKLVPWQNTLMKWLKFGNGIFWVSGKAGSGKSTFMKFISEDRRTREALEDWAGARHLVIARFFFWNAGTHLQKSQEGLLRSLLFEVLRQYPNLIEVVFPSEWRENSETGRNASAWSWTRSQLMEGCSRLAQQSIVASKFCFFVDGLDEYSGDHVELVHLLCDLFKSNENVKICLSSRAWNVFQAAFHEKGYPSFLLEDLTRDDITFYVQSKLGENEMYCKYMSESMECQDLVKEIVSRANGVFLWVFLVVRSLIRGLQNEDRLSDLKRRLQSLPTDLEEYFRHMMYNVDEAYKGEAARSFQIALKSKEPLTLMTYSILDDEDLINRAISSKTQPMTTSELEGRYRIMKKRLNARCQDLLEVTTLAKATPASAHQWIIPGGNSVCTERRYGCSPAPEDFFIYRVDFLHRTVRDFLETKDMQDLFANRLPESFDPIKSLCASFLQQIKSCPVGQGYSKSGPLVDLVGSMMLYARESELQAQQGSPQTRLLDELERVLSHYRQSSAVNPKALCSLPANAGKFAYPRMEPNEMFLALSVQKDLVLYVTERLDDQPSLATSENMTTLLLCALFPNISPDSSLNVPNPNMVRLLLDKGANPNWGSGEDTIWVQFLASVAVTWEVSYTSTKEVQLEVIRVLLSRGVQVHSSYGLETVWVDFLLMRPDNWLTGSDPFECALCEAIEKFLSNGVDVNHKYKGSTIWGHFVDNISSSLPRRTKVRLLRTVELFLRCGADPYFDYRAPLWQYVPHQQKNRKEAVLIKKLRNAFSDEELVLVGMPLGIPSRPKQESSSLIDGETSFAEQSLSKALEGADAHQSSPGETNSGGWLRYVWKLWQ